MQHTTMRRVEPETNPLGPKKTFLVIATVLGCIGILWPKVFHPMLIGGGQSGSTSDPMLPPGLLKDRGPGCCGVVLDTEVYMNSTLGADARKYRDSIHILVKDESIRQERPLHMRPDPTTHPAMRERGFPSGPTHTRTVIDGRPGPIPGMRPAMGGGAFQQASPKGNSMGLVMPLYTLGILAFFVYTIMKIMFKKPPTPGQSHTNVVKTEPQKIVPEQIQEEKIRRPEIGSSTKLAIQGLIDAADEQLKKRTVDEEDQDTKEPTEEKPTKTEDSREETKDDQQTVKVLGMELTSTYEGGKKWDSAPRMMPSNKTSSQELIETVTPQEIYLEGTLPHESQILVSDAEQRLEEELSGEDGEDPAIILSSKMTLSLISLDHEDKTGSHGKEKGSRDHGIKGSAKELVETIGASDTQNRGM